MKGFQSHSQQLKCHDVVASLQDGLMIDPRPILDLSKYLSKHAC